MGGSPNDIRISDMRPTLVEPPMYKPKVVLLGKDKKGTVLWALYVSVDTCSSLAGYEAVRRAAPRIMSRPRPLISLGGKRINFSTLQRKGGG